MIGTAVYRIFFACQSNPAGKSKAWIISGELPEFPVYFCGKVDNEVPATNNEKIVPSGVNDVNSVFVLFQLAYCV